MHRGAALRTGLGVHSIAREFVRLVFSEDFDLGARKSSLGIGYATSGLVVASERGAGLQLQCSMQKRHPWALVPPLLPPTQTRRCARVTGGCNSSTVLVKQSEVQNTSLLADLII